MVIVCVDLNGSGDVTWDPKIMVTRVVFLISHLLFSSAPFLTYPLFRNRCKVSFCYKLGAYKRVSSEGRGKSSFGHFSLRPCSCLMPRVSKAKPYILSQKWKFGTENNSKFPKAKQAAIHSRYLSTSVIILFHPFSLCIHHGISINRSTWVRPKGLFINELCRRSFRVF